MKWPFDFIDFVLLAIVAVLAIGPGGVVGPSKPDAVTYTYDDKRHAVPSPVSAAISALNGQGIEADLDEVDTTDPSGDVPEQFKVSRPAAVAAGLPALVVMGGGKVIRVVKDPKTEAAVLEAAK